MSFSCGERIANAMLPRSFMRSKSKSSSAAPLICHLTHSKWAISSPDMGDHPSPATLTPFRRICIGIRQSSPQVEIRVVLHDIIWHLMWDGRSSAAYSSAIQLIYRQLPSMEWHIPLEPHLTTIYARARPPFEIWPSSLIVCFCPNTTKQLGPVVTISSSLIIHIQLTTHSISPPLIRNVCPTPSEDLVPGSIV